MALKDLAYGGNDGGTDSSTYRTERGFPFYRAGQTVYAIPQFKAQTIFSHAANAPNPFKTTQTGKNIAWPIPPQ